MRVLLTLINERINAFLHNVYVQYNRLDLYLSERLTRRN
jgi:hypothetical protein